MAITRAQIARQLLQFGGGADMGGVADSAGNVGGGFGDNRDRGRERSMQAAQARAAARVAAGLGDPDPNVDKPIDTITSFSKNLKANLRANPFSLITPIGTFLKTGYQTGKARSILGLPNQGPQGITGGDAGQDIPYWAQLGFSSEEEYLASLRDQASSTKEQEPGEDEGLRLRFAADGGRIEAQEGGIMPRLNQLGSGVSSAEQTLQDINQRLESAESSLGGSGGNQFSQVTLPETLIPSGGQKLPEITKPNPMLFAYDPRGPFNMQDAYSAAQQTAKDQREQGFAQKLQLPGEMTFEGFSNYMNNPQQLSGIPAASYANGGNVVGGEFDFESARQMYGLGKLVKKATRAIKKVADSPIGKAALLYTGAGGLGNLATGSNFFANILKPQTFLSNVPQLFKREGLTRLGQNLGFLARDIGTADGPNMLKERIGPFSKLGIGSAITAVSLLPLLGIGTGDESEEEAQALLDQSGIDIEAIRSDPNKFLAQRFRAEEGGKAEPVAKKTMPLLDMGGQEMDLRAEGGFVPIGRMEKADDVPARLSKNEFVFTADAVRNAGDGNVDKGAEVMYNMMKNLEAGGNVSEESQGLEGARKMFQTSKRLEEVL